MHDDFLVSIHSGSISRRGQMNICTETPTILKNLKNIILSMSVQYEYNEYLINEIRL